jgi:hypothetical protein
MTARPLAGRRSAGWARPIRSSGRTPFYGSHSTLSLKRPVAYYVPSYRADLIERLKLHGVTLETVPADKVVTVEMIRLVDPKLADRANEGHVQISVETVTTATRDWTFPKGSVRVPTDQPLGDLDRAAAGAAVQRELLRLGHGPRGAEPGRIYRVLRHRPAGRDDAGRRSGPEGRVRGQAGRRAQRSPPIRKRAWPGSTERTPFYDDHYLLYPIAREIAR